jgi:hypothetical protein
MYKFYTVYLRDDAGSLRAVAEHIALDSRRAYLAHRELHPEQRGPFVVLPALTSTPLCVD